MSTIGPSLPLPYAAGWIYLNLMNADDMDNYSQAWVTVFQESKGRNSVSHPAIVFN